MDEGAHALCWAICVLVIVGSVAAPVGGQSTAEGITGIGLSGSGVISSTVSGNDSTYLWSDEPFNASVTFTDSPAARNYAVCIYWTAGDRERKLVENCPTRSLSNGTNETVAFTGVSPPSNATGEGQLRVELRSIGTSVEQLDERSLSVTAITKGGDADKDGLSNQKEVTKGLNLSDSDIDDDGLDDGDELQEGTDPQDPDTDGDGLSDRREVLSLDTDPTERDTDGDGLADGTEVKWGVDPTRAATPLLIGGVALAALAGVVGLALLYRRRPADSPETPTGADANGGGAGSDLSRNRGPQAPEPPVTESNGAGESATPAVGIESPEGEAGSPGAELLTDEDRVLALLEEHGGRMKQAAIVEATEWSKAKVSRLLSGLDEEGRIEKLSIGRENIISLAGHGPEAARSPHDE
ncbi:IclR-like transcriptional regulator [Halobacteriales archaeon QS_4_69_34]|nr:MAG: IclR-like transcriptional regulator [Halobacteriales archaeon QS_4_69_34]